MKAAIVAAFGVVGAPSTIGTRIDVGEGKHSQRRDEKNDSSHESLLNTDSNNSASPITGHVQRDVMPVTLLSFSLKVSALAGGMSIRNVATKFGVNKSTVQRVKHPFDVSAVAG